MLAYLLCTTLMFVKSKMCQFFIMCITLSALISTETRITTVQAGPVYMMALLFLRAVSTYTNAAWSKCIIVALCKNGSNSTKHILDNTIVNILYTL